MRHLFGPVNADFADQNLAHHRAAGNCLTFGDGADVASMPEATWPEFEATLPPGWKPAFIALWLPYTRIPDWAWTAPIPIIGLAADWQVQWHAFRNIVPRCDAVLCDGPGVDTMRRAGFDHANPANLFGLRRSYFESIRAEMERDIDVVFVGNMNPAIHRERLSWLARLAKLGKRGRRVVIATNVFGEEYQTLLRRSKIAFNRSVRGECNQRVFEAAACGALLFQEAGNIEVPQYLEPNKEYVPYGPRDLDALIDKYLLDDGTRQQIADAARERVRHYSYDALWTRILTMIGEGWPAISARSNQRPRVVPSTSEPLSPVLRRVADFDPSKPMGDRQELIARAEETLALASSAGPPELAGNPWPDRFDLARVEWEKAAWSNPGFPCGEAAAKRNIIRAHLHLMMGECTGELGQFYESALAQPESPISRAALGCALARAMRFREAEEHLGRSVASNPFDLAAARAYGQVLADCGETNRRKEFTESRRLLAQAAPGIVPLESWFAEPTSGLASLIVLCCNEVDATRLCLESVQRHTRTPYELILVDNGSTDETPQLLKSIRGWVGPTRVHIIRNDENKGYPAGVNQGLAAAHGDWIVLLNNDTAMTPRWLDELIEVAQSDVGAGLVGPVSNYAPEPQFAPSSYLSLDDLDAFAEQRREHFGGKYMEFERLTGFCLLIRRALLEKIGHLDEQFGAGFFDDDDLCLRARRAGWKLRIALGVYIHHEGSRTFRQLGINTDSLLNENLEKFRAKWGDAAAARYRAPTARTAFEPGVSATIIVRNEEANIADCIGAVRDLVDEVVVLDTGSTDRTRDIARELGAKVHEFTWIDDFSAARNEALKYATKQWVLWLDADDRLDDANRTKLQQLLNSLPNANAAFSMKCHCLGAAEVIVDHVRLFRNDPRHRWCFRVHEQILPALNQTGAKVQFADVEFTHVGYVDPDLRAKKLQRDLRLLDLELKDRPDHPFALFNLGSALRELGRPVDALPHLARSLELSHPKDSISRKLFALVSLSHLDLKQAEDALRVCETGRKHYPDDPELLYIEGLTRTALGEEAVAESCFRRLVDGRENGNHFASVSPALRGHLGRHRLAELLAKQNRVVEAEAQWRLALSHEPAFAAARIGLAEIYLTGKNWVALDQVLEGLGEHPEAELFRGRAKMARKECSAARWTFSQLAERHPRWLDPKIYLSYAVLQEGKDMVAAERAVRDVLALDPHHVASKQNLEVLLRQRSNGR